MTQGLQFTLLFSGLDTAATTDTAQLLPELADPHYTEAAVVFRQMLQDEQQNKTLRQGQTVAAANSNSVKALEQSPEEAHAEAPLPNPIPPESVSAENDESPAAEASDMATQWLGLIRQANDTSLLLQQKAAFAQQAAAVSENSAEPGSSAESEVLAALLTPETLAEPKQNASALLKTEAQNLKTGITVDNSSLSDVDLDKVSAGAQKNLTSGADETQTALVVKNSAVAPLTDKVKTAFTNDEQPQAVNEEQADVARVTAAGDKPKEAQLQAVNRQSGLTVALEAAVDKERPQPIDFEQRVASAGNALNTNSADLAKALAQPQDAEFEQLVSNNTKAEDKPLNANAEAGMRPETLGKASDNTLILETPEPAVVKRDNVIPEPVMKTDTMLIKTDPGKNASPAAEKTDYSSTKLDMTKTAASADADRQPAQQQSHQDHRQYTFNKLEVAVQQNISATATSASPVQTTESAAMLARTEHFSGVLAQQQRAQNGIVNVPDTAAQLKQLNLQQQDAAGQLRERVQVMLRQNIQVADIRLDPAELGQMQIRVNLQQEQASVQFIVQQQHAKELLEQQMPRLRELLQQQGIQLGEGQVQQQARQDRQSAEQDPSQGARQGTLQSEQENDEPVVSGYITPSERLVDYYA